MEASLSGLQPSRFLPTHYNGFVAKSHFGLNSVESSSSSSSRNSSVSSVSPESAFTSTSASVSSGKATPEYLSHAGSSDSGSNGTRFSPVSLGAEGHSGCLVCEDKASGLHYGIASCEGCKGFFRRTVQKKLKYKCHRQGGCDVSLMNRNRCQACRFRRCLEMGMSQEAVRGEKQTKAKSKPEEPLGTILPDLHPNLQFLVTEIHNAHEHTCHVMANRRDPDGVSWTVSSPWTDMNEFSVAGASLVAEFVRQFPVVGDNLNVNDRRTLLKHACLEIMMLRVCYNYDMQSDRFVLSGGLYLTRQVCEKLGLGFVVESLFGFARLLAEMRLDKRQLSVLAALCYMCADRPGIENFVFVESYQESLLEALSICMIRHRPTQPYNYPRLLTQVSELRCIATKCLENMRQPGQMIPQALADVLFHGIVAPAPAPVAPIPFHQPFANLFPGYMDALAAYGMPVPSFQKSDPVMAASPMSAFSSPFCVPIPTFATHN